MTTIHIFGMPVVACDSNKTWKAAADLIGRRLQARFGENIHVIYVELFSPESFKFKNIMERMNEGQPPPFILVNDKLIQSGGKLSERLIAEELIALSKNVDNRLMEID